LTPPWANSRQCAVCVRSLAGRKSEMVPPAALNSVKANSRPVGPL
jgi:hypothetical protein